MMIMDDNRNCFRTVTVLVVEYLTLFFDLIFFSFVIATTIALVYVGACVCFNVVSVVSGVCHFWGLGVLGLFVVILEPCIVHVFALLSFVTRYWQVGSRVQR